MPPFHHCVLTADRVAATRLEWTSSGERPNGGWTYDTLTRRWGDGKLETERWANDIHNIAKEGGDQQSAVREKEYGEV